MCSICPQLVVLFWKILETLGGGADLGEVGHYLGVFGSSIQALVLASADFWSS